MAKWASSKATRSQSCCIFDPSLFREEYDGIVFRAAALLEITSLKDPTPATIPIAEGGRYDKLLREMTKRRHKGAETRMAGVGVTFNLAQVIEINKLNGKHLELRRLPHSRVWRFNFTFICAVEEDLM